MAQVTLTYYEQMTAAMVGVCRQLESIRKGSKDNAVSKESGFGLHVEGALGEQVVAKCLGIFNPFTVNTYSKPDLPPNLQVKTRPQDTDDLFVKTTCKDDEIYVLVVGRAPTWRVAGWITGEDAKKHELKYPGGKPVHLVLQSALHPIEELPRA